MSMKRLQFKYKISSLDLDPEDIFKPINYVKFHFR